MCSKISELFWMLQGSDSPCLIKRRLWQKFWLGLGFYISVCPWIVSFLLYKCRLCPFGQYPFARKGNRLSWKTGDIPLLLEVKVVLKLVWTEYTSSCNSLLSHSLQWRCCSLVWSLTLSLNLFGQNSSGGCVPKKIYRLKEDQAFSLSLELGWWEKVARHPSADFLLHSVRGGGDFVDTVIAVKML
jgi:hypothetical protein